jgi:hypothetical protein
MNKQALSQGLIYIKLADNSTWYPVNSCCPARSANLTAKIWKDTQCSFCHSVQFVCCPVSCQSPIILYTSGKSGRASIFRENFFNVQSGIDLWWLVIHYDKWNFAVRWDAWKLIQKDERLVRFHLWRSYDYD